MQRNTKNPKNVISFWSWKAPIMPVTCSRPNQLFNFFEFDMLFISSTSRKHLLRNDLLRWLARCRPHNMSQLKTVSSWLHKMMQMSNFLTIRHHCWRLAYFYPQDERTDRKMVLKINCHLFIYITTSSLILSSDISTHEEKIHRNGFKVTQVVKPNRYWM